MSYFSENIRVQNIVLKIKNCRCEKRGTSQSTTLTPRNTGVDRCVDMMCVYVCDVDACSVRW